MIYRIYNLKDLVMDSEWSEGYYQVPKGCKFYKLPGIKFNLP